MRQICSFLGYNLGQNKVEQLSPIPQSNDEGAKEQKRAILPSLNWGEGWSRCSIYFVQDCNLGQYKMEQLSPISPQSNDEGAKEQKTRHFGIIEMGGRGGPDVPFILSKIVARSHF